MFEITVSAIKHMDGIRISTLTDEVNLRPGDKVEYSIDGSLKFTIVYEGEEPKMVEQKPEEVSPVSAEEFARTALLLLSDAERDTVLREIGFYRGIPTELPEGFFS